jgi:hypothetical protein
MHLAQLNIAALLAPIDDPQLAGFVARLDEINRLADETPGFVWRYQTPKGNALDVRVFDEEKFIVNMSVWTDLAALHQYTYYSAHVDVFRQRRDWFEKLAQPHMVLWWIPVGHIPDLAEAKAKLEYLQTQGASPLAFTFKEAFTVEQFLAAQAQ